jgi:hypothetical protein
MLASSPAPAFGAPANGARAKGENLALITIEFHPGRECTVTTLDESLTSDRLDDVPAPSAPASEYRCPIRSRPRGRPIALTVILPPGESPAGADFPRLAWAERDTRWIGTASLPSAPAFVRVPTSGSGAVRRTRLLDWAALAATAIAVAWTFKFGIRN